MTRIITTPLFSTLNLSSSLFKKKKSGVNKANMTILNSKISEFTREAVLFREFLNQIAEKLKMPPQHGDITPARSEEVVMSTTTPHDQLHILVETGKFVEQVTIALAKKYQEKADRAILETNDPAQSQLLSEQETIIPVLNDSIDIFFAFKSLIEGHGDTEKQTKQLQRKLRGLMVHNGYLPGSKDELLDLAGVEMHRIAIACITMSCYLVNFCLISHGAAVAAVTFGVAAIVLGGLGAWIYLTNHKKDLAVVFDELHALLNELVGVKLPVFNMVTMFSPDDISELDTHSRASSYSGYEFIFNNVPHHPNLEKGYYDESSCESNSLDGLNGTALLDRARKTLLDGIAETGESLNCIDESLKPTMVKPPVYPNSFLFNNTKQVISQEGSVASDEHSVVQTKVSDDESFILVSKEPETLENEGYSPCRQM